MADLSPQLLERRRQREARPRPWREIKATSPVSNSTRSTLPTPDNTPTRKPYLRRSEPLRYYSISTPIRTKFRRTGPFPFLRLPFEVQILVGEFAVQYQKPLKCEDFVPYKDGKPDEKSKTVPKRPLSRDGHPSWIPLLKVCPWLTKDLSRTWYRCNTFYVKSVLDWNAFISRAGWENANRITSLHVDNELIYCPGETVGKTSDWRSYVLIAPMKNLKVLTLYRDDGGPGAYSQGGHDEFNSVDWFVKFADQCKSLEHIEFALYPWSGFDRYPLANSNMVAWIKDWEHEWNAIIAARKPVEMKASKSWYLTANPVVT